MNKLTKSQELEFNKWCADGNVVKVDTNLFKEQSTQWKKAFTYEELVDFFLNNHIN